MEYTIKRGDTLSALAKRHGLDVEDLMRANPGIRDPDKIYEGDDITILSSRGTLVAELSNWWKRLVSH